MSSTKCMQCGLVNWQTATECKRCQTPLAAAAEYYQTSQPVYPYSPPPPPVDFSQPQDYPQHYPQMAQPETQGLWKDGATLVMGKDAALLPACVKCNRAVERTDFRRKLHWHPPALYFLIFAGWLVYVIVALVVRKKATVWLGLCEMHRSQRRYLVAMCWLLALLGTAGISGAIKVGDPGPAMIGALVILASLLLYSFTVPVVVVKKMDDHFIWLKKVHKDYLAQLPSVPGRV